MRFRSQTALALLLAIWTPACVLDLSQAPCEGDTNCPQGQYCGPAGACLVGAPPADRIERLYVEAERRVVARGDKLQLAARGVHRDGTVRDLTADVTWSTSNAEVAAVSEDGEVTAANEGAVRIGVALDRLSGEFELTVTAPKLQSLAVNDELDAPLPRGVTRQLSAVGTFTDGTTADLTSLVSWSSAASEFAKVSTAIGSKGRVTGRAIGSTTVQAELAGVSGARMVHVVAPRLVQLDLTPSALVLARGTTRQLTATGIFTDQTTQDLTSLVTWSVTTPNIASVSNVSGSRGLVTTVAAGTAEVSASLEAVSATLPVVVTQANLVLLSVTPTDSAIAASTTQQLMATGIFSDDSSQDLTSQASWSSSATAVATISNAPGSHGLAAGKAVGTAAMTASFNGISGTATLTVSGAVLTSVAVSPNPISVAKGAAQQLKATGTFSDSSTQDVTATAFWSSSNSSIATVSDSAGTKGRLDALSAGSATVTATVSGISGSAQVSVSAATLTGLTLSPSNASMVKGTTRAYQATGSYSDGSTLDVTEAVTWSSSSTSVVTISNAAGTRGVATAIAAGTTSLTASLDGTVGTTQLTVTAATLTSIAVTPADSMLARGTRRQLTATGTYSDSSTQDLTGSVTWASSNTSIATVSNATGSKGEVSAVDLGTTVISAIFSGVTGSTNLSVTAAVLSSLSISPVDSVIFTFATQQFTATGTYSDGTTQDVTAATTWASSNTSVATISNAAGFKGQAQAVAGGTTTISGSYNGQTAQTNLTVQ